MADLPREGFTFIDLDVRGLPAPHAQDSCKKCDGVDGYLARYIKANSSVALRWVCNWCQGYKTTQDIPHSFLKNYGVAIEDIPKIADNSIDPSGWPECCVCDSPGQEGHHWAPLSIFPEWRPDLVVVLCTICHREWHARMRAHGLRWPHEIAA